MNAAADVIHRSASDLGVPGLCLYLDFVTEAEEAELLSGIAHSKWQLLARREVCHYGYEFQYAVRTQTFFHFPLSLSPISQHS